MSFFRWLLTTRLFKIRDKREKIKDKRKGSFSPVGRKALIIVKKLLSTDKTVLKKAS